MKAKNYKGNFCCSCATNKVRKDNSGDFFNDWGSKSKEKTFKAECFSWLSLCCLNNIGYQQSLKKNESQIRLFSISKN